MEWVFRYIEDLALAQGMMQHVKLLQGLTVAAETLVGEIIFFPLSGEDNFIYFQLFYSIVTPTIVSNSLFT